MYSVRKELLPEQMGNPETAVLCRLFNNSQEYLVLNCIRKIQVLRFESAHPDDASETEPIVTSPIQYALSFEFSEDILDIQTVPLQEKDGLILVCNNKMMIATFDENTMSLKIVKILMENAFEFGRQLEIMSVDRLNRLVVFKTDKLFVLPIEDVPHCIDLQNMDKHLGEIVATDFLHGFERPTLLVLHNRNGINAGQTADQMNQCAMMAVSLCNNGKFQRIVWTVTGLPSTSFNIMSLPPKIGGCLVFSTDSIIHLNQNDSPTGVSLNGVGNHSANFALETIAGLNISLDCAQITFISEHRLVMGLKNGDLYFLALNLDPVQRGLRFLFSKNTFNFLTPINCISVCDGRFVFLGSRLGNSILLRFTETPEENAINYDSTVIVKSEPDDAQATEDVSFNNTQILDDAESLHVCLDIKTPIGTLIASLQEETMTDLSDYQLWVNNEVYEIQPATSLADLCSATEGFVQVELKLLDSLKRINIIDITQLPNNETVEDSVIHQDQAPNDRAANNLIAVRAQGSVDGGNIAAGPLPTYVHRPVFLLEFLRMLLNDPNYRDVLKWRSEKEEFQIIEPNRLAQLWGEKKNNPNMTYEKLSRALRNFYKTGELVHVEKCVYKFNPRTGR